MSERRWLGVIIGVVALIFIIPRVWNNWQLHREYKLSYNDCSVSLRYMYNVEESDEGFACASNELALCICESYLKTKSRTDSNKIMQIYHRYGFALKPDSVGYESYKHFDSILKYRRDVFNTGCFD